MDISIELLLLLAAGAVGNPLVDQAKLAQLTAAVRQQATTPNAPESGGTAG